MAAFGRLRQIMRMRAFMLLKPYLVAGTAVALAGVLRLHLDALLGPNRPFIVFIAAVALAAWQGGARPAIFAMALSYFVANIWFMPPIGEFNFDHLSAADWANVLVFVAISSVITASIEVMRRARTRAEEYARQVQDLLEQSRHDDQCKDEFLATLAHELRNPLAPLSNALQLWSTQAPDAAEAEELREVMWRQVRQISRLIEDLMDISRIKHGRIQLRKTRSDLRTLVRHAVEAAQPIVDQFGHQLHVRLPIDPLWLDCDGARITQVFTNILFNAAKHTVRDGQIWVSASQEDQLVVVRIRDNGPGIPPAMLLKIFELFTQGNESSSRPHAGLGIGLALVKQLVDLHAGSVEAISEGEGTGCEFVVKLRAAVGAGEETTGPSECQDVAEEALSRHKIIVVDDLAESATTLAKMLRSLGQDVLVAQDGSSTVELVQSHHCDVAIVDIAMPVMDGYEVARRLRAQQDATPMVLIALTGFGQQHDRRRAFEAGFNYHLTKPTSTQELTELLHAI
ncbi:MAG TPA: ATP-binding protein [Pirellulales bacterium]|nr:ATP-binding protein [Pirellulales bacterium]